MSTDTITRPQMHTANRRNAIVQNVTDALGYRDGATSLGALLASASVLQEDVIRELGSNDELISAVAGTIAQRLIAPLAEPPTEGTFITQLLEFSRHATHEYSGLRMKNLYRMLVADTIHGPSIKGAMYRHGPMRVCRELTRFFSTAQSAGVRVDYDCHLLATYFMALLRSYWDLSDKLAAPHPDPCEHELAKLIEVFFSGIQARTKHA